MADHPPSPPPTDHVTEPPVADEFPALRRSESDRVIAGVLGGLGRRLGVDPVLLRIVTVVLAIFGGVGVLLYALGWLIVPADDEDGSILDKALGRGERDTRTVPMAFMLTIAVLATSFGIIIGSWDSGVLLVLATAGVFVLLHRRDEARPDPAPDVPPAPTTTTSVAAWSEPIVESDPSPPGLDQPISTSTGWPEGPDWNVPRATVYEPVGVDQTAADTPAPKPAKTRSHLGSFTFCAMLLAIGVVAIVDSAGTAMPVGMYVAVPLAVVGAGILVGTWYGRSRGLIALGFVLSLLLAPVALFSTIDTDEMGVDLHRRITSADQLPTGTVTYGAGRVRYDLSDLTLSEGRNVTLTIDQGAGDLVVTVPADADVTVDSTVAAGELVLFGEHNAGVFRDWETTDNGADGPGGGTIDLDLQLGMGTLEVVREPEVIP